jgi:hypothetical protein
MESHWFEYSNEQLQDKPALRAESEVYSRFEIILMNIRLGYGSPA